MEGQIVSITFFEYQGFSQKWTAFTNMGLLPRKIAKVSGLQFFKLMGSGKRGFSLQPNWGTYSLLGVWDSLEAAKTYFASPLFAMQKEQCASHKTHYMRAYQAKGEWDSQQPFSLNGSLQTQKPIAVITRATLKLRFLYHFWKHVPGVRRTVFKREGRIFSIGVGERPFIQQVTFSIWESAEQMEAFAYHSGTHAKAIAEVRNRGMFKEELYARFEIVDA